MGAVAGPVSEGQNFVAAGFEQNSRHISVVVASVYPDDIQPGGAACLRVVVSKSLADSDNDDLPRSAGHAADSAGFVVAGFSIL